MTQLYDNSQPPHIERANSESRRMFSSLRGNEQLMWEIIGSEDSLDLAIAWEEFDRIAYQQIFAETGGDSELLFDHNARGRIFDRVRRLWPTHYFMKYFVAQGIMDVVNVKGVDTYFFKERYKQPIRDLLSPRDPS